MELWLVHELDNGGFAAAVEAPFELDEHEQVLLPEQRAWHVQSFLRSPRRPVATQIEAVQKRNALQKRREAGLHGRH